MKFAVLDFETTGDQPGDEAIQVGLVIIEDRKITTQFSSYIKPSIAIPPFITGLTGITEEDVADAPSLEDVLIDMVPLISGSTLVAHHASFDLSFLQRSLQSCGYMPFDGRVLDTVDWLRLLYPTLSSLQLSFVSKAFDITHDRPHQADSDAEATAHIWLKCLEKLDDLPLVTLQRVVYLFEGSLHPTTEDLLWFLHTNLEEREREGFVDNPKYRYYRQFALSGQEWTDDDKTEFTEEQEQLLEEGFDAFADRIREALKERLQSFEDRPAQDQMMGEVHAAFDADKHLLVEAGTGTGKSLGYLVPSIYYSLTTENKVVVSTHTITLQEQLFDRDIPLLHELFPVPFRSALLKGRHHYLCLRKFEQRVNTLDPAASKEERLAAAMMVVWLADTLRGDDDEIQLGLRGSDIWSSVASDTDSCLNRACPWFRSCFYHRARHEASQADVVITNHSLLFSDMKADHRLLPSYRHLILDEAHQVEEVASNHLGMDVHYFGLVNPLLRMMRDSKTGQLPALIMKLENAEQEQERAEAWASSLGQMLGSVQTIKEQWDLLYESLYTFASNSAAADSLPEGGAIVFRLKQSEPPIGWDKMKETEENLYTGLSDTLRKLEKVLNELKEYKDELDVQSYLTDLNGTVKDLYRVRDATRFFVQMADKNYVYWMEMNPAYKSKSLQLSAVPIDVSDLLREQFFGTKESVVLTSATLSIENSFQYVCEQLGLDAALESGKAKAVKLPSPFRYREQALVVIPRDFPIVKGQAGEAEFVSRLIPSLAEAAKVTGGRMLVLFTSYKMLKQIYEPLKEALRGEGIGVLGQGQEGAGRNKLVRMFQQNSKTVLLGTSSFWEGVDIPGDALTCLAIVRLPFSPPNHPLVEARSEFLKKQNKNPFMKLSVPQAVIKFKQGFGRLVRTANDHGIVIIYDTRVLHTQYGKHFLYSLPGPKIEHMSADQMIVRMDQWLKEKEQVEMV
ncbi:ATP-dependent DNA helicase DinG [Paenibacillus turpanensis]|uniref:ATP-dependent DNA helicase DinG n=1 Tax=Paenibacillus turpanensis TaxID=2689078 RepID=UPI001407E4D9|nr:ATP-dependent DNA helicase DinG [Paenibacillus turpanensis]